MSTRLAMSLLEIAIAVAPLAVLMTVSVQMIRALGGQQRSVESDAHWQFEQFQALVEQIGNMPWEKLTAESIDGWETLPLSSAIFRIPNW